MSSWCRCFREWDEPKIGDKLKCDCGEEWKMFEWSWEDAKNRNVILSNENREVFFHPKWSTGMAAIKGTSAMTANVHYYWEIKILSILHGSAVMIGIGTSNMKLSYRRWDYSSTLGCDGDSWGYSYTGEIQHNQLTSSYGSSFTMGSLVGIHLDMCNGTLEYYLNRKPLGIAFMNLKEYELYPVVCSTAARCAMRITCCFSKSPSLQIECLKVIRKRADLLEQLRSVSGIFRILQKNYFWLLI